MGMLSDAEKNVNCFDQGFISCEKLNLRLTTCAWLTFFYGSGYRSTKEPVF